MNLFTLFRNGFLTTAATLLLFAAPALAQGHTAPAAEQNNAAYPTGSPAENAEDGALRHHISIGAAGIVKPDFEGADSYRIRPFPLVTYHNQYFFISTTRGAGVNVLRTPTMTAGPLVSYRFGRDENNSHLLRGLGDVDGGVEVGGFFNWQFHPRFGAGVRALHGTGNAEGFTADANLTYNQPLVTNLNFVLRTGAQFASEDYNEQFFGITQRQSRRSGYDEYSPGNGIKHVSVSPMLNYRFFDNYTAGVFYEYKRLTGPAADSPLVERGSANQHSSGVSLTWSY